MKLPFPVLVKTYILNSVYDSLNKILNKEKYLDKVIQDLYQLKRNIKIFKKILAVFKENILLH